MAKGGAGAGGGGKGKQAGGGGDFKENLKNAILEVNKEAGTERFVKLHLIKDKFPNMTQQEFNKNIEKLANEGKIRLNPGNPRELTAKQIAKSFQDKFGDLYLTITPINL